MMEIINDAISFGMVIGGFSASMLAIARSPIGKFAIRSIKREGGEMMLTAAKEANGPLEEKVQQLSGKVQALDDYARYHLGPNGSAPALHVRIDALEKPSTRRTKKD